MATHATDSIPPLTGLVALPLRPEQFAGLLLSLSWCERDALNLTDAAERGTATDRAFRIRTVLGRLACGEREPELIAEMRALIAAHDEDCRRVDAVLAERKG